MQTNKEQDLKKLNFMIFFFFLIKKWSYLQTSVSADVSMKNELAEFCSWGSVMTLSGDKWWRKLAGRKSGAWVAKKTRLVGVSEGITCQSRVGARKLIKLLGYLVRGTS